jgi:archaellum component FlaC
MLSYKKEFLLKMNENQTIDQIKERLEKFIDDIDHVNPNEVKVEDIDEWIGLLDQLEEKVKTVSKTSE